MPDIVDKHHATALLQQGVERLATMQELLYANSTWSLLIVFQAMDAAGKDSTIKHVMTGVNPQGVSVTSFKVPGPEDLAHDFLWRTSRALPARGMIGIFNRSHYEEVLVTRVHPEILKNQHLPPSLMDGKKFWDHRLEDIGCFERHLTRQGTRVLKFFLNVGRDEQKKRFLARLDEPAKTWKFSAADIKERGYWDDYMSGLRGGYRGDRHRRGALVRGAGGPEMVHAARRGGGHQRGPGRARPQARATVAGPGRAPGRSAPAAGGGVTPGDPTPQGRVTRRSVRLIRPPPGSRVEEPAIDAVDAVEAQPRRAAEHDRVARAELDRPGRAFALGAAPAKQRRVAERQRQHGRIEILLVAVLVQPHSGVRVVEVDQAGLGSRRIAARSRQAARAMRGSAARAGRFRDGSAW